MSENKQELKKSTNDVSASERFTNAVVKEFSANVGEVELTSQQKRLIQNYFIKFDLSLKAYEQKRLKKANANQELPYVWGNINMGKLAQDVVIYSSMGIDAMQKNHINLIPYKNSTTNQYDVTFIDGYVGKELIAKKYGYEVPNDVVVELVYENDIFKPIKKDLNNKIETYLFEIAKPFERGEIVGAFYYKNYLETPQKNTLKHFPLSEILKRVPAYASAEFWGGEKDKWEGGKKVGKEKVEGWFIEMCEKTVKRMAYGSIPIDSTKIDDQVMRMIENEEKNALQISETTQDKVNIEINQKANAETIDFEEVLTEKAPEPIKEEKKVVEEPKSFEEAGF